jgi:heptosyltransferase-2
MNILVIRFSSMGDIIVQTPFLKWLKSILPKSNIHFLTLKMNKDLIDEVECIDSLHLYEKKTSLRSFCKELKANNSFDLIIDLHGTTRSFLTKLFMWNIPSLSVDKRRIERFLLVKTKLNFLKKTPSQHSRTILDFHRIFDNPEGSDYTMVSNASIQEKNSQEAFFVIAPGASFGPKRYPIESFKDLAIEILTSYPDIKCKILAGEKDNFCNVFNSLDRYSSRIINLQGQTNLKDSLSEVEGASFLLSNDSLMGHIAQSAGVPALVIYGPTSEDFGFAPNTPLSKAFSVDGLWCRPCSTTGSKKCIRKEQFCFTKIDTKKIKEHIDSILENS